MTLQKVPRASVRLVAGLDLLGSTETLLCVYGAATALSWALGYIVVRLLGVVP